MSRANRGGNTLKTGKIGRFNCLRQTMLMPGEKVDISIQGSARLESLRERDVMRINATLCTFLTPLRWLWPDWPNYVKEGPDTALVPPKSNTADWAGLGIGSYNASAQGEHYTWYFQNILRIFNEWIKWPEDPDITGFTEHGPHAVPLSKVWNRCRYNATPDDAGDYQIDVSGATMDVRDLAEKQARFRGAMKRDVLSFNRWQELIDETWRGDGSREVDQVPMLIDLQEVGVNPREIPATDGASLGQWQSLFDFGINHRIPGVIAPEHCILSYFIIVRFAPIVESCAPIANANMDWFELVGDPEYLASAKPVPVVHDDLFQSISQTQMGYLPAGWQWRCDHDVVGRSIDIRDSFPYMLVPTTQAEAKDATRIKDAFRTQALDDYIIDLYFKEDSRQPIGDSMDSYMSGMVDDAQVKPGGKGQEFPKGGKQL